MSDRYFIDTNIFIYLFDKCSPEKSRTSRVIIKEALDKKNGLISFQVVQEFMNAAVKRFPQKMSHKQLRNFFRRILRPLIGILPDVQIYEDALEINKQYRFSFYDSLIIAAAQSSACNILLSEDLQSDQTIEGVRIVNPYKQLMFHND